MVQSKIVVQIPEGVNVKKEINSIVVTGPEGEVRKKIFHPRIDIKIDDKISFYTGKLTKKEKCLIGTFSAHLKNMIEGVGGKFMYKLKVCSGHFPMSITKEGNGIVIKNFLGEKVPRKAKILENVDVEIKGDEIVVISANKELAGQTAANIEQATRITKRDKRKFQDGCYITIKAGKEV